MFNCVISKISNTYKLANIKNKYANTLIAHERRITFEFH